MRFGKMWFPALLALCVATPVSATTIFVTVSGIAVDGTNVYASLCTRVLDPQSCPFGEKRPATAPVLRFSFDVPPGRYAAAAYQDVNRSGRLEHTRMGLPLEPFGFSNEAGRARRPTFEGASFLVGETRRAIELRLRPLGHGPASE